jgi:hypothetical protein
MTEEIHKKIIKWYIPWIIITWQQSQCLVFFVILWWKIIFAAVFRVSQWRFFFQKFVYILWFKIIFAAMFCSRIFFFTKFVYILWCKIIFVAMFCSWLFFSKKLCKYWRLPRLYKYYLVHRRLFFSCKNLLKIYSTTKQAQK